MGISGVAGVVGNSDVPNGRRSLSLEMDEIHRDRGVDNAGSVRRYMVALLRPPCLFCLGIATNLLRNSPPLLIAIPALSHRTSFCSNFCILGCNGSDGAGISGGQHREAGSRELGGARR